MAEFAVVFARSARKELQTLDPPVALRVLKSIEALVSGPRPAGARKLEGETKRGHTVWYPDERTKAGQA